MAGTDFLPNNMFCRFSQQRVAQSTAAEETSRVCFLKNRIFRMCRFFRYFGQNFGIRGAEHHKLHTEAEN